jgi:hypothetical protein
MRMCHVLFGGRDVRPLKGSLGYLDRVVSRMAWGMNRMGRSLTPDEKHIRDEAVNPDPVSERY